MIEYGHGDDTHKFNGIDFKANFSSNVFNLGAHTELKEYLRKQLDLIESYPAPSSEDFIELAPNSKREQIKYFKDEPVTVSMLKNGLLKKKQIEKMIKGFNARYSED